MTSRLVLAGLLVLAGCAPALAAGPQPAPASAAPATSTPSPKLSNFADQVFSGYVGENAPELSTDLAAGLSFGTTPLQFEKTNLANLAAAFGGQVHTQGDPGNAASWVCYTQHARTRSDTPKTVWFVGDDKAGRPSTILDLVVVENVDAGKASGCATAPPSFVWPDFGIPAIGASIAGLEAKLGPSPRDHQGNVYYNSTRALGDGSGKSVYQTLGYVLNRKGTVLGLALGQMTN